MRHFPKEPLHDCLPAKALLQFIDGLCHLCLRFRIIRKEILLHLIRAQLAHGQAQQADRMGYLLFIIQFFRRKI